MSKVSFKFDNEGYIRVGEEKYSALEILNDAGDTALDWMLASDNAELVALASTWGLTPDKDDKTGSVEEKPTEDPENEGNVDEAVDKSDTGSGGLSNEEITSLTDKLNILFGYKVVKGVVQKDKNGKPVIANQKAAIKITGGAEPKIQADGTIDIPGDVTINLVSGNKSLPSVKDGKFTIKFGIIGGNFICRSVKLSSLEGGPKKVNGQFDISKNELTSLVGSPDEVGSFFATDNKKLTSLTGGPKIIKGITDTNKNQKEFIYDVSGCALTTLEGNGITSFGPGGFNCGGNKITSLAGLGVVTSTGVTRFDCSNNQLTSLNGIPKPIKDTKTGRPGNYWISNNIQITVFPVNMADFEVDGFVASGLSLTSLSFAPKQIYGDFDCSGNKGAKKLTNQSIGKDRFVSGGGFEADAGNRIVKIDGEFITSEGTWKDKTYDRNTEFKKSEAQTSAGFAAGAVSGGVVTFKGTGGLISGQAVYLVEGIRSFTIGYDLNTPNYVPAKKPTPTTINEKHGNFLPRQGLNGGKNSYAGGAPSSAGLSSWKGWGEKYKSFINLSFFENYLGGSGTAPGPWGPWSPNGATIINGKNYGSKADGQFGRPFYYVAGGKSMRSSSGAIFKAKSGSTQSPISNGAELANISVGACAASGNWCDSSGNYKDAQYGGFTTAPNAKNWPFFGQLTDGTWFAGATEGTGVQQFGPILSNHFKSKGKQMKILDVGDGGGSAMLAVNGRMIMGGGRPVPIILAWS
jgi:hypothetical protein